MEKIDVEKQYKEEIAPQISKEKGGLNMFAVPRVEKAVLNAGVGSILNTRKMKSSGQQTEEEMLSDIIEAFSAIAGQKPQPIKARKSIASFKLREGTLVGLRTTLRGKRMYDFIGRLINIALPRTRDFRGIPEKAVDQGGNLTIGIKESNIFPEAPPSNFTWGFEITFVTNTKDREEALDLFKRLGVPFEKSDK